MLMSLAFFCLPMALARTTHNVGHWHLVLPLTHKNKFLTSKYLVSLEASLHLTLFACLLVYLIYLSLTFAFFFNSIF